MALKISLFLSKKRLLIVSNSDLDDLKKKKKKRLRSFCKRLRLILTVGF